MSQQAEGNGGDTAASEGMSSPPPRRDGWVRLPGERDTQLMVALGCAALLVVGGLGPWIKFGMFSASGTDGDGWFLIGAGLLSAYLLARFNSREGQVDRWTWLIPVAGAVGSLAGLISLIDLLGNEFVSVGWALWVGIAAGLLLVGLSIQLIRPSAGPPLVAILVALLVAGAGAGIGFASADGGDGDEGVVSWTEDETWAEPEGLDEEPADDQDETVFTADPEDSEEVAEEPEPETNDCDALGINPEQRREGSCVTDGQAYEVANRDSKLKLTELNARLLGIETTKTITSEYFEPAEANGTFVIVNLEIENRLNTPSTFDSMGEHVALLLDGNTFTEDTEAASALETSFWSDSKEIQPKASRTGAAVFDIPNRFVRDIKRGGNVAILNFSEINGFTDYESPEVIGIIRTGQ